RLQGDWSSDVCSSDLGSCNETPVDPRSGATTEARTTTPLGKQLRRLSLAVMVEGGVTTPLHTVASSRQLSFPKKFGRRTKRQQHWRFKSHEFIATAGCSVEVFESWNRKST